LGVTAKKTDILGPGIGVSSMNNKNYYALRPIVMKLLQGIATMNGPSWVVLLLPNKSKMAVVAILHNRKILYFGQTFRPKIWDFGDPSGYCPKRG